MHEFDYIYDSSHGSTIYARIYLDGSYTKCESIKIYGFTEETLFDRVKNAELKANNAYDSSSKINNFNESNAITRLLKKSREKILEERIILSFFNAAAPV